MLHIIIATENNANNISVLAIPMLLIDSNKSAIPKTTPITFKPYDISLPLYMYFTLKLRRQELNLLTLGYEPSEPPVLSTPRYYVVTL